MSRDKQEEEKIRERENNLHVCTYPSPSRVIAVSAKTLSTRPTVALAWQSIPRRQLSSASCLPVQETTTRYRVLPGCTDSSFTACKGKKSREFFDYSHFSLSHNLQNK